MFKLRLVLPFSWDDEHVGAHRHEFMHATNVAGWLCWRLGTK